jgi:hypothetical protein
LNEADPSGRESLLGEIGHFLEPLNPVKYYEEEIESYENGCGYLVSVVHGLEGTVVGVLDASGAGEEGAATEGAVEGSTAIEDALAGLTPGNSPGVYTVDSPEELQQIYDELSAGGKPTGSSYPGREVEPPDGTRVGIRKCRTPAARRSMSMAVNIGSTLMNNGIHSELLDRGLEDILQLSEMAGVARRHLGGSPSEAEVMRVTTGIIGGLMDAGHAIVGDVAKDRGILYISSWGLGSTDTIQRIEDEWSTLGRPPNLGDVCWLELTESGRAHALDVYRPRYRIDRGLLQVWFSGGQSVKGPSFECLLSATGAGELVGIEIPDCRRQLENVSFPDARADGAFQWSYDAERDTFSIRFGLSGGKVQKSSTGEARVDGQGSILGLRVTLGDEVTFGDRDLTFLETGLS